MLLQLHEDGELPAVSRVEYEPEYGYATRIVYRDGRTRTTYGNDPGVNPGAAAGLADDKGFTKHFLRAAGIACPRGETFVLPHLAGDIGARLARRGKADLRTAGQALAYLEGELGLPAYVKPVRGAKGRGVWRCESLDDATRALACLDAARVELALVEEAIDLPDHRIVVFDGAIVSAYRRVPLAVTGDGERSLASLLDSLLDANEALGRETTVERRDARVGARLDRHGLAWSTVPGAGERVTLLDVSNLSAGGTAVDLTGLVAARWEALALALARAFGLRLSGIDIACDDLRSGEGAYAVLEINAAPGLDHYASSGDAHERAVRALYARVLGAP
jgi:D-alanine-D-alanine ligase-like ATP-grasp enzyme